jgi:hypothetical protein
MSDTAPKRADLQFKLSIESPLKYAAKSNSKNVVFAVDTPYPLLRSWYEVINSTKSTTDTSSLGSAEEGISGQSGTESEKLSYCDLFESCIPSGAFALVRDVKIRQDIEESLRKRVLAVKDSYKRTKGGKRLQLDDQNKRFHVFEEYITSVGMWNWEMWNWEMWNWEKKTWKYDNRKNVSSNC